MVPSSIGDPVNSPNLNTHTGKRFMRTRDPLGGHDALSGTNKSFSPRVHSTMPPKHIRTRVLTHSPLSHTHVHAHTRTNSLSLSLSLSLLKTFSVSHTRTHTNSLSLFVFLCLSLFVSLSFDVTHTQTLSHTLTLSHTHTHRQTGFSPAHGAWVRLARGRLTRVHEAVGRVVTRSHQV